MFIAPDAAGPLTSGERLLIRTVRLLALGSACLSLKDQFEQACGYAGAEAYRAVEVFLQQLALRGRRRLALSVPTDPRLTADEALILEVFGCAQADDYRALEARLEALAGTEPPASLGAAASLVAQAFGMNGLVLRAEPQCWLASTTPSSTAAQCAPAAATTWPCQMARANRRRLFT